MAIKYIDVTGKTEAEAIDKALEQLGRERDDVSVEILERSKSGFFGIGASPAKVRVSYEVEDAPAARAEEVREEKPRASRQEKGERKRSQEKREPRAGKSEKAEKPPRPPKAGGAGKGEEAVPAAPEALGEEADDEKARQIKAFLAGLLEHMDSGETTIRVYLPEKDRYKVFLEGEKMGQLIGRRGETLDAIQQLTNYAVNRDRDKRVRIHVDAENYREKREQSLEHLARKTAAKVVKYRRSVTLEPMNAYERHVIHATLQDYPDVSTHSTGTEPGRRVVVSYNKYPQDQDD